MAKKAQIDKFREAARGLEADEHEGRFDEALKRVAKGERAADKPTPKKPEREK